MPKFFVDKKDISEKKAVISGSDVAHITKVLRLSTGACLTLCDGEGTDYMAQIAEVEKDRIILTIESSVPSETEPEVLVTLFQGLPKASKMEYIIQKCTELGVHGIVPIATKRAVVKLENAQAEKKKLDRWNKIAQEAVKQCGRGKIPKVCEVSDVAGVCKRAEEFDLLLLAYEEERECSLSSVLRAYPSVKNVGIIIGPEGGFAPEEAEMLQNSGAKSVSLGKRILRTETAGHTVLTAVLYECGELE